MTLLDTALKLLGSGMPVFPVGRDKKPLVAWKQYQERLPIEEEVKTWWNQHPYANIGLTTGHLSGLIVVDPDSQEATRAFKENYPEAKETLQAQTGREGARHFYFIHEPGITNDAGKLLGPGIDVRGEGGYVVVPPSIHANGKSYQWLNKNKPIALPDKLRKILVSRSKDGKPFNDGLTQPDGEKIPDHQRNVTLTSLAGSMRRRGMSEEAIKAAILKENSLKCDPPLDESEVNKIAKSVAGYPPAEAKGRYNGGDISFNSFISYSQRQPKPILEDEALYGLPGAIVKAIDPYTEADPVAVLSTLMTGLGNIMGRGPHFRVEFTNHYLNLFIGLVGETSKGRKGQSWSTPRYIFKQIDEDWVKDRVTWGLSSGEGLVFNVRDETIQRQPIKEKGRVVDYEDVVTDKGVEDKRLFLIEEELSQALKVMSREGNILSAIIRQAWDSGDLHPLTKNNPIKATGAHISVVGHITKDELLRHLDQTERANGFANRFIWLLVGRSKAIPNPQGVPLEVLSPLIDRLREAITFANTVEEMRRDNETERLWAKVYSELSEGKPGMVGAIISRAEAQAMRLACLFDLMDCSPIVRRDHLKAALALWDYSEKSARVIFGNKTGDRKVDKVKAALRESGRLTLTDISSVFGRNLHKDETERIIETLLRWGMATVGEEKDGEGRPVTVIHDTN